MRQHRSTKIYAAISATVLLMVSAGAAWAQPADALFSGFVKNGDYMLEVDGELDQGAEIFFQQRIPAYLVLGSKMTSPVLLMVRTKAVQSVHIMKVKKNSSGSVDLMADAVLDTQGRFELEGTDIRFNVGGETMVLKQKPDLLGLHPAEGLQEYSANYVTLADAYSPSSAAMSKLRGEQRDVHMRVYMGSWCPFCQRYLPRTVRIAKELADTKVRIDFYGLPKNFDDEVTQKMNVSTVPTGVVFVDGREVGRLRSEDWQKPEEALQKLLSR